MFQECVELQASDYFKNGEQVYIHIDKADSKYTGVMHKHDFIEIVYVISGSARHYMGEYIYEVHKGDLIIVNYGTQHTFIPLDDRGESFSTYDLLFTTELFEITGIGKYDFSSLASSYLFYSMFPDSNSVNNSLNLIRSNSKDFQDILGKIYSEYTTRKSGFMSMIRAYLIELITLIFREIDQKTISGTTKEQREVVNKAIDYMKHHYNTRINLDSIVSDIFLSKDYFRQLFKKTTGMSVTDFIQKTRVDEACRLLTSSNRTVFDIAGDCGFTDIKFFYKTFKKITGKTPSEYRKQKEGI
ncbi:MAG: helix-turn-helix domain-containing protein [Ruminococcaceae bacterium]|nr:helix-turn-helix domain-containing protein [Oscillospiraceae bacterium]